MGRSFLSLLLTANPHGTGTPHLACNCPFSRLPLRLPSHIYSLETHHVFFEAATSTRTTSSSQPSRMPAVLFSTPLPTRHGSFSDLCTHVRLSLFHSFRCKCQKERGYTLSLSQYNKHPHFLGKRHEKTRTFGLLSQSVLQT